MKPACAAYREAVASVEEHVQRWRAAGVLDEAAAERIRAFEGGPESPSERPGQGPGILEALIYLGVAVAAVGVIILVSNSWSDLREWARVAVVGVPGLFAIAAGSALRTLKEPGMVRGGHVAWLAASVLLTGAGAIAAHNADWSDDNVRLLAGLSGTGLALLLWVFAPSHPQVIGIGAGLYMLSIALGERSDEFSFPVAGMSLAAFALAALVLVEAGLLRPRVSAQVLAAVGIAWGAWFAGFDRGWIEALAFVAGAALVAVSIWRGAFIYIAAGVAAIFAGLISTIVRHVDNPTTASLFLIVIGALMVGSVITIARFRPWARQAAH